jgi:alginate O-acetyltransferase complex protein AlgI
MRRLNKAQKICVVLVALLVILVVASTPLAKKLWGKLGENTKAILSPVLVLLALVLCTASLVDASYNPFLYFRF